MPSSTAPAEHGKTGCEVVRVQSSSGPLPLMYRVNITYGTAKGHPSGTSNCATAAPGSIRNSQCDRVFRVLFLPPSNLGGQRRHTRMTASRAASAPAQPSGSGAAIAECSRPRRHTTGTENTVSAAAPSRPDIIEITSFRSSRRSLLPQLSPTAINIDEGLGIVLCRKIRDVPRISHSFGLRISKWTVLSGDCWVLFGGTLRILKVAWPPVTDCLAHSGLRRVLSPVTYTN